MSEVQTWLGALGVKSRASRLSATGRLCLESLVASRWFFAAQDEATLASEGLIPEEGASP